MTFESIKISMLNYPFEVDKLYSVCLWYLQKERDLELAAKIGQTLLTKNQELSEKNDVLEEQLVLLSEKVNKRT